MKKDAMQQLKEQFFAQYWGQSVYTNGAFVWTVDANHMKDGPVDGDHLLLRPITALTSEEAIFIAQMLGPDYPLDNWEYFGRRLVEQYMTERHCIPTAYEWLRAFQYLQSRGIALPFFGFSVDELVFMKWIKLQE